MNITSAVNVNMAAPVYSEIANTANAESAAREKANALPPVEAAKESAKSFNRDNPNQRQGVSQQAQNVKQGKPGKDREVSERGSSQEETKNNASEQDKDAQVSDTKASNGQALTEQQLDEIKLLAARDREVRTHERAHAVTGGALTGSPSYTYEKGPDGRRYAVAGEVSIDASPVPGNPEATIRKMEQVRQAALAPAEPSSQDRKVAAMASQTIAQSRVEVLKSNISQPQDSESQDDSDSRSDDASSTQLADKNREKIEYSQEGADIKSGTVLAIQV